MMSLFKYIHNFFIGRWYALYVSGHGSGFRRDGGLMTKRTALFEADRWVGIADTIGGRAQVKNIFTYKVLYPSKIIYRSLKIVVALAVLMAAGIAYAEVPDVSKWSCPNSVVETDSDYDSEFMFCGGNGSGSFYVKISSELVYIHEHRTIANKAVYYNALKTNEGNWVETVNQLDLIAKTEEITNKRTFIIIVVDDKDKIVARRSIPLFKK